MGKNLPANAGDMGSIPGPGGSHVPCGLRLSAVTAEAHEPRACALTQEKPLQ